MDNLQPWVIEILKQSPLVVVTIVVFFLAEKRVAGKELRLEGRYDKSATDVAAREDTFRSEARQDRDAEIKRLQEAHEKLLAAKDEQIGH